MIARWTPADRWQQPSREGEDPMGQCHEGYGFNRPGDASQKVFTRLRGGARETACLAAGQMLGYDLQNEPKAGRPAAATL